MRTTDTRTDDGVRRTGPGAGRCGPAVLNSSPRATKPSCPGLGSLALGVGEWRRACVRKRSLRHAPRLLRLCPWPCSEVPPFPVQPCSSGCPGHAGSRRECHLLGGARSGDSSCSGGRGGGVTQTASGPRRLPT